MTPKHIIFIILLLFMAPAILNADDSEQKSARKWRIALKPGASAFLPASTKVQNLFGSKWSDFGVSVGLRSEERDINRFELRADSILRKSGNNHAYLVPVGVGFKHRFSKSMKFSPYIGVGGSICGVDLQSNVGNLDTGIRAIGAGSAFLGVNMDTKFSVEANYYRFDKIKGYDLSGFRIYAGMLL